MYSMSVLIKVEVGYATAKCRHTVIYLKSPIGGRMGAERLKSEISQKSVIAAFVVHEAFL